MKGGNVLQTSNLQNPSWSLANVSTAPENYTLRLVVTNGFECKDSAIQNFQVFPNALANIILNGSAARCAPFAINNSVLTAAAYPQANSGYSWQVFDLSSNSLFGPSATLNYTIATPNTAVWVVLTSTSAHGCLSDVDSIQLETIPNPVATFTASPNDTVCHNQNIQLSANPSNPNLIYSWYNQLTGQSTFTPFGTNNDCFTLPPFRTIQNSGR
jgi:hypothetical protein